MSGERSHGTSWQNRQAFKDRQVPWGRSTDARWIRVAVSNWRLTGASVAPKRVISMSAAAAPSS